LLHHLFPWKGRGFACLRLWLLGHPASCRPDRLLLATSLPPRRDLPSLLLRVADKGLIVPDSSADRGSFRRKIIFLSATYRDSGSETELIPSSLEALSSDIRVVGID
jgi:hypothetical protein